MSSGGLKGRLRRALSFNASVALKEEVGGADGDEPEEEDDDDDESIKASRLSPGMSASVPSSSAAGLGKALKSKPKTPALIKTATARNSSSSSAPLGPTGKEPVTPDDASIATVQSPASPVVSLPLPAPKKKSRAASLFSNSRLNASTDNISLSSTVSSASVMIRKLGSMGRLARRNSLAGITSLFKDKDKNKEKSAESEDGESGGQEAKDKDKKGKKKDKTSKKRSAKAEVSEASVSHVTAELDRSSSSNGDWSVVGHNSASAEMTGLSPAAKLARQHTLKSNAEAAAKAEAARTEAAARAEAVAKASAGGGVNGSGVATWERNTATRQGSVSPVKGGGAGMRISEDGTRVFVEPNSSDEEDDRDYNSDEGHYGAGSPAHPLHNDTAWDDDDDDWGVPGGEDEDTIRVGKVGEDDNAYGYQEEPEPWAVDVRRSVERARIPTKGILKCSYFFLRLLFSLT